MMLHQVKLPIWICLSEIIAHFCLCRIVVDDNTLMYQRWLCKNKSSVTIASFIGADISIAGGEFLNFGHRFHYR